MPVNLPPATAPPGSHLQKFFPPDPAASFLPFPDGLRARLPASSARPERRWAASRKRGTHIPVL